MKNFANLISIMLLIFYSLQPLKAFADKTATLSGDPDIAKSWFNKPPENPMALFKKWIEQAQTLKVREPKGLVLSTVNDKNEPSSRVLLLKGFDDNGVIFATGQNSAKGRDIESNANVACNLWWRETMQQINFKCKATKLPSAESDKMFQQRTQSARAIATVSKQSQIMHDEVKLKNDVKTLVSKGSDISRPETWHGYHCHINSIEFWHGSPDRFHKRLRYDLVNGKWVHNRLQP